MWVHDESIVHAQTCASMSTRKGTGEFYLCWKVSLCFWIRIWVWGIFCPLQILDIWLRIVESQTEATEEFRESQSSFMLQQLGTIHHNVRDCGKHRNVADFHVIYITGEEHEEMPCLLHIIEGFTVLVYKTLCFRFVLFGDEYCFQTDMGVGMWGMAKCFRVGAVKNWSTVTF